MPIISELICELRPLCCAAVRAAGADCARACAHARQHAPELRCGDGAHATRLGTHVAQLDRPEEPALPLHGPTGDRAARLANRVAIGRLLEHAPVGHRHRERGGRRGREREPPVPDGSARGAHRSRQLQLIKQSTAAARQRPLAPCPSHERRAHAVLCGADGPALRAGGGHSFVRFVRHGCWLRSFPDAGGDWRAGAAAGRYAGGDDESTSRTRLICARAARFAGARWPIVFGSRRWSPPTAAVCALHEARDIARCSWRHRSRSHPCSLDTEQVAYSDSLSINRINLFHSSPHE